MTRSWATAHDETQPRSRRCCSIGSLPYRLNGASATIRRNPSSTSSARTAPVPARPRGPRARSGESRALDRSEEHTSELQSPCNLVCRLLLEKKKKKTKQEHGKTCQNIQREIGKN